MVRSSVVLVCFVALLASVGCQSEGAAVQSWWGPLDSQDEGTPFSSGGQFEVFGFGHRVLTESTPARDLVEVVLVGAGQPGSCAAYATYMQELVDLQAYLDEVMSAPEEESPPAAVGCP